MKKPINPLLREALNYDQLTGVFTWKINLGTRARIGSLAGYSDRLGYHRIDSKYGKFLAHRIAWFFVNGEIPEGFDIDHINGNPSDNRISNLRLATHSQNMQNQKTPMADNKLGLLGVTKVGKKFKAQIAINGKHIYLGYFDNQDIAHKAYIDAKRSIHSYCSI